MVDEQVALGAESRAATGRGNEHCRPLSDNASMSQSRTLSSPSTPLGDQVQWPSLLVPDIGFPYLSQGSFTYERASGGARSIDAITVALSRQHLHNETQNTLAEVPAAVSASSPAAHFPTDDLILHASSSHHQPTSPLENRPHVTPPRSSNPHMSSPTQQDMQDLPIDLSVGANNTTQLWRRIPPRQSKVLNKNKATQALLESMICSETQCNVQASPLLAPAPGGPHQSCSKESESCLEVDEITADGTNLEMPDFDKLLEARCFLKPPGINKSALPGYRSSTETALRCRNLVRSRPRMRKRTKLREQVGSSAMSSAASPTEASSSTVT